MKRRPVINFLKAAVAAGLSRMIHGRSGGQWSWSPSRNKAFLNQVGDMTDSNVVMAPLQYIARTEPEAPICLKDSEGEMIHEHPMLALLKRPNPYYSGALLRMGIDLSFNQDGNAYLVKIRNSRLRPVQLWYVPHFLMEPAWDHNGEEFITHYSYRPGGQEIKIAVDDVIHIRNGIDPNNIRKGLAPLKSAIREIFTDDEAASFSAHILRNMGIPGMIIAPDSDMPADQGDVNATKLYIQDMFSGSHRGEPLVLRSKTKVETFSFSPQDLDLSGIRNISEERVCALLGIPAAVVGFGTGIQQTKVGATMKELREMAYENGIIPMHRLMAEELSIQLLPDFEPRPEEYSVVYDYSDIRVLQEDQTARISRLDTMVKGGWLRVDHAQALAGMEVDDSQAVYLRGLSIIEVPAETVIKPPDPAPEKRLKSAAKKSELSERLARLFLSDELRIREVYATELKKRFDTFGKKAEEIYREAMTAGTSGKSRKDIDPADDLIGKLVIEKLIDEDTKELIVGYRPHYLRVAHQSVDSINAVTNLGINLTDTQELKIVSAGGRRMGLIDLDGQTKKAVFDALADGREAGEGVDAVARRIRDKVGSGRYQNSRIRSELIARTETKYAQNISSLEAYRGADSIGAIQVLDSQLGSFDEYCDSVNGIIVTFEEADRLAEEEHPNGTRSFIPVFGRPESIGVDGLPVNVPPNNPEAGV